MKVAVLMGGPSAEREVSIHTGQAIVNACIANKYETIPLEMDEHPDVLVPDLLSADVVFIALHGGIGENGTIQGFLQSLGIPYTGSGPLASALCMDKHLSKTLVRGIGIPTPDWTYLRNKNKIPDLEKLIFPVVVKPNDQGSTVGLSVVHRETELKPAVREAYNFSNEIIVESYIAGRELTVSIVGEEVYPIVEIIPDHEFYDYECKYSPGMSQYNCPADLPKKLADCLQSISQTIYSTLKCKNYGRIDFRLDRDGKAWFLEVNTLPGMTETSLVPKAFQASGGTFEELIKKIIEEALIN